MKKKSILVLLIVIIMPQVVSAAWWNPVDWFSFIKEIFSPEEIVITQPAPVNLPTVSTTTVSTATNTIVGDKPVIPKKKVLEKPVAIQQTTTVNTSSPALPTVITPPSTPIIGSIQITYPQNGESFERGKAYSITFNAGDRVGKMLRLYLTSEEPIFSREFAGTDEALSGSQSLYLIVPPDAPTGSKYKVVIYECIGSKTTGCVQGGNALTSSSGYFSIK